VGKGVLDVLVNFYKPKTKSTPAAGSFLFSMDKKTINILFYDEEQGWVTGTFEVDTEENEEVRELPEKPVTDAPGDNG